MAYVCFNGEFLDESELKFTDFSRLRFADSLFESMLWYKDFIPLESYHYERLANSAQYLNLFLPNIDFQETVGELLKFQDFDADTCRIRVTLFRNFGKLYTPDSDTSSYLIECESMHQPIFSTIENLGIYQTNKKSTDALGNLKTGNALIYVLAKQFAKAHFYDEVVLINTNNQVAETASSNIFMVKNSEVYTPPLSSGCVSGIMRNFLEDNFEIIESNFSIEELKQADEIFLTNAISLVQPVLTFDKHTLSTNISKELINFTQQFLLNEI
jgi:branched-chain amino acid aminotransferase